MGYMRPMVSALLRLLAAMSLMFMPLGMAQAAVAEAPPPETVEMRHEISHCPDHSVPGMAPASPHHHCAACAAIPAIDPPLAGAAPAPAAPLTAKAIPLLLGLELEIATPPPREA